MSIYERVQNVLVLVLGIPASWVTETADLYYDLLADSLGVFQAIAAVEEEFDVDLGEQFDATASVAGIVTAVARELKLKVQETQVVSAEIQVACM